jgi:hypothetical protein
VTLTEYEILIVGIEQNPFCRKREYCYVIRRRVAEIIPILAKHFPLDQSGKVIVPRHDYRLVQVRCARK